MIGKVGGVPYKKEKEGNYIFFQVKVCIRKFGNKYKANFMVLSSNEGVYFMVPGGARGKEGHRSSTLTLAEDERCLQSLHKCFLLSTNKALTSWLLGKTV